MSNTKVFPNKYGKHELFAVFKVDEDGEKGEEDKPIVSMGLKKAKAILAHVPELEAFVKEQEEK